MDPILTTILAALVAGATAKAKDVASTAVSDVYDALKSLLIRKLGKRGAVQSVEDEPDSEPAILTLAEALAHRGLAKDAELAELAENLKQALQAARHISPERGRADVLIALVPRVPEELQKDALRSLVLDTSWENRRGLLTALEHCFSVLTRLEGRDALCEIERALCDTGRWFP